MFYSAATLVIVNTIRIMDTQTNMRINGKGDSVAELRNAGAFTLLGVACLTIMVGCVIVPGLSEIAPALGVSHAASWLVTVPSLGVVVFGPLAGRLIDRFGAWHSLAWGLFLYGVLGAGGVFLHGFYAIMLDRLLLGGATAIVMSAGTGLISSFYQDDARLKMIARQGMSIELGGVIFLFIGGILATLSWRWPFLLYLMGWVLLMMQLRFVPHPVAPQKSEVAKTPVSGVLKPVYMAALLSMVSFFTAIILIPEYFHQQGIGAAETGYFLSFISLIAVIAAAVMPEVMKQLGGHRTLIIAFVCYLAAHLMFSFAAALPIFMLGGVLLGCGFGLSIPLVNHMTVDHSEEAVRGQNLAYLAMAIFSGQFLSSFMVFIPGNISWIFSGAALLAGLSCAFVWFSQRKQRSENMPST